MIGYGVPAREFKKPPEPAASTVAGSEPSAWMRARPWFYVQFVITLFAFAPFVRRLVEFVVGTGWPTAIQAVPLAGLLVPVIALFMTRALGYVNQRVLLPVWIWIGGFTTSAVVGACAANGIGVALSYVDFVFPAIFAVWMTSFNVSRKVLFERISGFLLGLSTPVCLYAFFQYVVVPPWDRNWLIASKTVSFGLPVPFQIRPWSTFAAPAEFSDFIVITLLLTIPRMSKASLWRWFQVALLLAALIISRVRADWLALVLGGIAYLALTPHRVRNFVVAGVLCVVLGGVVFAGVQAAADTPIGMQLSQRFQTFGDLDEDSSYKNRQRYFGEILKEAISQPVGLGLGITGAGARLSNNSSNNGVFDNGYVARLTEMGYFGFACYLAALATALGLAYRAWRSASDPLSVQIAAACIGIQLAIDFVDVTGDHHMSVAGLLFWMTIPLLYGRCLPQRAAAEAVRPAAHAA